MPSPTPTLKPNGAAALQAALDDAAAGLPGCTLAVVSADGVLFDGASGPFDVLQPEGRKVSTEDVMWFASTTKLLTSICYLQLVDNGKLSLDTDMRKVFPALDAAASKVITGFNGDEPILEPYDGPVTLASLLNQTSGFGREFGEVVPRWKKTATKGTGFVNSCKVENLINTPLCFVPGTSYEYGNSAEWLGLMFPHITGVELEDHLQQHVFGPLGMKNSTFFPFGTEWKDRLMPLRFKGEKEYEVLKDQLPLLTLPRSREEIEYPVAGGGIYSNSADYVRVLQYLLQHHLALTAGSPKPPSPLLSDASVESLFLPSLPQAARAPMAEMLGWYFGEPIADGDADWSTGMSVFQPKDGRRRGGDGRRAGSVGWGGAAGTQYWIDAASGIAVVFTTQVLPGSGPATQAFKNKLESAIYAALE